MASQRPIAERTLQIHTDAEQHDVVVRLYAPQSAYSDFECTFTIDGLPEPVRSAGYGVDSFQSLILALTSIERALAPYRDRLSWFGKLREHGIPPIAMGAPDPEQNIFIAELLERETEHYFEIALLPKGRHMVRIPDEPRE